MKKIYLLSLSTFLIIGGCGVKDTTSVNIPSNGGVIVNSGSVQVKADNSVIKVDGDRVNSMGSDGSNLQVDSNGVNMNSDGADINVGSYGSMDAQGYSSIQNDSNGSIQTNGSSMNINSDSATSVQVNGNGASVSSPSGTINSNGTIDTTQSLDAGD